MATYGQTTTMTDSMTLRLSYLQEAAHVLAVSSPSVCAFIGTARDRLIENSELEAPPKEWDAIRRETCGACGNLMVPGWSCQISNKTQTKTTPREGKRIENDGTTPGTSLIYHCLRCDRQTEQTLQPQPQRHMKKKKDSMVSNIETTSKLKKVDDIKIPKTANASSKQRQKNRKGGLQAMLEKNKTQTSKVGFDLMDFAM